MISPISGYGSYGTWGMGPGMGMGSGADTVAQGAVGAVGASEDTKPVVNPGESDQVKPGKRVSPAECETCKERKYQDG
ncbi:MAG: hypothetical protein II497_05640, partial [Lachnospiraceae bacterium]|nr:hypothetical protein [Lachnospiraceae bacterium]